MSLRIYTNKFKHCCSNIQYSQWWIESVVIHSVKQIIGCGGWKVMGTGWPQASQNL